MLPNLSKLNIGLNLTDWNKSKQCCFTFRSETTYGPFRFYGCEEFYCRVVAFSPQMTTEEREKINGVERLEVVVYQGWPVPLHAEEIGERQVNWKIVSHKDMALSDQLIHLEGNGVLKKVHRGCDRMFAKAIAVVQAVLDSHFPQRAPAHRKVIYSSKAMVGFFREEDGLQQMVKPTNFYRKLFLKVINDYMATPGAKSAGKLLQDGEPTERLKEVVGTVFQAATNYFLREWAPKWLYRVRYFHQLGFVMDSEVIRGDAHGFQMDLNSYASQAATDYVDRLLRQTVSPDSNQISEFDADEIHAWIDIRTPCDTYAHYRMMRESNYRPNTIDSAIYIRFTGDLNQIVRDREFQRYGPWNLHPQVFSETQAAGLETPEAGSETPATHPDASSKRQRT